MSKAAMSKNSIPMFWYEQFWHQRLYEEGIENSAKGNENRLRTDLSCNEERKMNIEGNQLYYWIPNRVNENDEVAKQVRLFVKESRFSSGYKAVVDVIRSKDGNRLISRKAFGIGDPITFLSEFEEGNGMLFVGGVYARKTPKPKKCNAYLTRSRMLRCTRPIKDGDEIIRWMSSGGESVEYLERIDRMVVSAKGGIIGRISSDVSGTEGSIVVNFDNGDKEVAWKDSGLGFVYKETFNK